MKQYINKTALVAEIKKLIRENELYLSENASDVVRFQKTSAYSVLNNLLHFLDTLEVKEVQEESVSKDLEEAAFDYAEACKYDGGEKLLCVEHFKDGAKWQQLMSNTLPNIPLDLDLKHRKENKL